MSRIEDFLDGVKSVAITGHINPDGDCVGSCLAAQIYLQDNYPQIGTEVYLQEPSSVFGFLKGSDAILTSVPPDKKFDLGIFLDIGGIDRIMSGNTLAANCGFILCIDHHKTNEGSYDRLFLDAEASSACEVLYRLLDPEKISFDCAQALYTGLVHDTGVFRFPCTSPETMKIAGDLIAHGIPFTDIIEQSFYEKSFRQNVMLGKVLFASELLFEGNLIFGSVTNAERRAVGLSTKELEGIVNQLGNTRGIEVSAFLYELEAGSEYKVSLRSKKCADVSTICRKFGGGGHARASGCTIKGDLLQVKALLLPEIENELKDQGLL